MKNVQIMLLALVCFRSHCFIDGKIVKTTKPTIEQKILVEKAIYEKKVAILKRIKK